MLGFILPGSQLVAIPFEFLYSWLYALSKEISKCIPISLNSMRFTLNSAFFVENLINCPKAKSQGGHKIHLMNSLFTDSAALCHMLYNTCNWFCWLYFLYVFIILYGRRILSCKLWWQRSPYLLSLPVLSIFKCYHISSKKKLISTALKSTCLPLRITPFLHLANLIRGKIL